MKWLLVAIAYTITSEDVPHEIKFHEIPFETQALCEIAHGKVEEQLKTRAVTVKATCLQVSEKKE
ncbi:hypothetical protein DEA8626_00661 [Defluviimonas aquaemixtae]|uniref:Uncharacterized protein n=1 Tax=Albidovulum aquaemixtae TaxID=1542388 RepID=A0A2R8B3F2_9RHOB|nr:hypothetical protein [Defluviimonas aquaemixtae]SPH17146.1 hypothetical protein DEA8626_00661 [Defluviimonas aquaemixtae]